MRRKLFFVAAEIGRRSSFASRCWLSLCICIYIYIIIIIICMYNMYNNNNNNNMYVYVCVWPSERISLSEQTCGVPWIFQQTMSGSSGVTPTNRPGAISNSVRKRSVRSQISKQSDHKAPTNIVALITGQPVMTDEIRRCSTSQLRLSRRSRARRPGMPQAGGEEVNADVTGPRRRSRTLRRGSEEAAGINPIVRPAQMRDADGERTVGFANWMARIGRSATWRTASSASASRSEAQPRDAAQDRDAREFSITEVADAKIQAG